MNQKLIFVIGKIASGKSSVAKILQARTNFDLLDVSDVVRQFAGKNASREELQNETKKHANLQWLSNRLISIINNKNYIVCGIREPHILYEILQQVVSDFSLILKIQCSDQVRFFRLCQKEVITFEQFKRMNEADDLLGIDFLMNLSEKDFVVFKSRIKLYELDGAEPLSEIERRLISILSKHLLLKESY